MSYVAVEVGEIYFLLFNSLEDLKMSINLGGVYTSTTDAAIAAFD